MKDGQKRSNGNAYLHSLFDWSFIPQGVRYAVNAFSEDDGKGAWGFKRPSPCQRQPLKRSHH